MIPRDKGFTLIELLIVVAIIGILAAIAVPNFMNARIRAELARAISDMKAAADALEMYRIDNRRYIRTYAGASEFFQLTTPIAYMTRVPDDYFLRGKKGRDINPDSTSNNWDYTGSDLGWGTKPPIAYTFGTMGPMQGGCVSQLDWAFNRATWKAETFRRGMYDISNGLRSGGGLCKYGGDDTPLRH